MQENEREFRSSKVGTCKYFQLATLSFAHSFVGLPTCHEYPTISYLPTRPPRSFPFPFAYWLIVCLATCRSG